MELAEFLLARIAEDEADARLLQEQRAHLGQPAPGASYVIVPFDEAGHPGDPARVLAECEAKRRIVESFAAASDVLRRGHPEWPVVMMVMKHLAQPYADHPDYQREWRP